MTIGKAVLGVAVVIAGAVLALLWVGEYECQACVYYNSSSSCQTVRGEGRGDTFELSFRSACGAVSRGVHADSMNCQAQKPIKSECRLLMFDWSTLVNRINKTFFPS